MTTLPTKYQWLLKEPGPRMLREALATYGTIETPGKANNPTIIAWAKETANGAYSADSIPWCGLWMAVVAHRAGWSQAENPLWALSWSTWGVKSVGGAMLGDVMVFKREGGGHVAMYVGEDSTHWHILGGNQSDKVSIVRRAKVPTYAVRRAPWRIGQPANVRKVLLTSTGTPVAGSEA